MSRIIDLGPLRAICAHSNIFLFDKKICRNVIECRLHPHGNFGRIFKNTYNIFQIEHSGIF